MKVFACAALVLCLAATAMAGQADPHPDHSRQPLAPGAKTHIQEGGFEIVHTEEETIPGPAKPDPEPNSKRAVLANAHRMAETESEDKHFVYNNTGKYAGKGTPHEGTWDKAHEAKTEVCCRVCPEGACQDADKCFHKCHRVCGDVCKMQAGYKMTPCGKVVPIEEEKAPCPAAESEAAKAPNVKITDEHVKAVVSACDKGKTIKTILATGKAGGFFIELNESPKGDGVLLPQMRGAKTVHKPAETQPIEETRNTPDEPKQEWSRAPRVEPITGSTGGNDMSEEEETKGDETEEGSMPLKSEKESETEEPAAGPEEPSEEAEEKASAEEAEEATTGATGDNSFTTGGATGGGELHAAPIHERQTHHGCNTVGCNETGPFPTGSTGPDGVKRTMVKVEDASHHNHEHEGSYNSTGNYSGGKDTCCHICPSADDCKNVTVAERASCFSKCHRVCGVACAVARGYTPAPSAPCDAGADKKAEEDKPHNPITPGGIKEVAEAPHEERIRAIHKVLRGSKPAALEPKA
jgi:hypothetical protein